MTPALSGFFNVCKAISSDMEQIAVEIKIQIQLGQELKVLQLFALMLLSAESLEKRIEDSSLQKC
ncbi:MAG TPA: hypothetical protein V6C95_12050 [Coleofasciculaceae cyanobacterium]